jgi:hypothetical protein
MFVFRCPKIGVPRILKVQALFLTLGSGKPTGKWSHFLPVFLNYELINHTFISTEMSYTTSTSQWTCNIIPCHTYHGRNTRFKVFWYITCWWANSCQYCRETCCTHFQLSSNQRMLPSSKMTVSSTTDKVAYPTSSYLLVIHKLTQCMYFKLHAVIFHKM